MTATIRMTYRRDLPMQWLAEMIDCPELHAVGQDKYEALGRLVTEFGRDIGIDIIWPPELERKWQDDLTVDEYVETEPEAARERAADRREAMNEMM